MLVFIFFNKKSWESSGQSTCSYQPHESQPANSQEEIQNFVDGEQSRTSLAGSMLLPNTKHNRPEQKQIHEIFPLFVAEGKEHMDVHIPNSTTKQRKTKCQMSKSS